MTTSIGRHANPVSPDAVDDPFGIDERDYDMSADFAEEQVADGPDGHAAEKPPVSERDAQEPAVQDAVAAWEQRAPQEGDKRRDVDAGFTITVPPAVTADPVIAQHHDPDVYRKRKKKRRKGRRRRRVILRTLVVILVVVALVVAAAGAAVFYLTSSIKAGEEKVAQAIEEQKAKVPEITNTVRYNGVTYAPNENMVSIAFIGQDRREGSDEASQADMVMVLSLNLDDGSINVIAIPRDSMVDVGVYVGDVYLGQKYTQLCRAFNFGESDDESSQLVADLASRILYDVPVPYYFTLDLSGIGPINDSIGGVTLTPIQTVPNTGIVEGETITLYNTNAQKYVQWRDTDVLDSSLQRQARQVQYLRSFATQIIEAATSDPAVLLDLYNTASSYSTTNLTFDEFSYLVSAMVSTGFSSLQTATLPGTMGSGSYYAEYELDTEGVRQVVLDTFYHVVDTEDADVVIETADEEDAEAEELGGDAASGDAGGAEAGDADAAGDAETGDPVDGELVPDGATEAGAAA